MKNIFEEKKVMLKEYIKPSLKVVVYNHQPLNVMFVSTGSGRPVDEFDWGNDNDNNNG